MSIKTLGMRGGIGNICRYVILFSVSVVLLFPVAYMLTNSFMDSKEVAETYNTVADNGDIQNKRQDTVSFKLIPESVSFMQYYNVLLRKPKFLIMFWNSVIITIPIIIGQIIVSSMAAYAFSKLSFPFRDKIFFLYIIVMMMPFQVTLVPNYIMLKQLDMLGTYAAVIMPGVFSTFGVFLLRQFMMYIPNHYCEAAKIDGAGYFRTFTGVMLPQCKGALASLAILVFIDNWNMVEQPLIFLKNVNMHPLSVFLSRINSEDIGIAFACGLLYMIPALLVFLYGEDFLIEGIQLSGIK
ncbi:MAG: carbohydrate ABC transporter permease [Clostridia bacterium]|nr:carbohydrate ABC transporter permease [Clostridia bacterium]